MNKKHALMIRRMGKWLGYWMVVGVASFVLLFLVTSTWIGVDVKSRCHTAQGKYEGDCVEALSQLLLDESSSLRERNYAIWTLGQLGDERALGVVESLYTGNIPDREPYDKTLSQYEMKKAIKLLDGGFNATAWVWR